MSLLAYLLGRAEYDVIGYSDILCDVWERRGLISSYKRLGQVVKELRGRLAMLGVPEDSILTIRGMGYQVNLPEVERLYRERVIAPERRFSLERL
jgi:DNA-binding winged helix-turn-helix (wHTH) protein